MDLTNYWINLVFCIHFFDMQCTSRDKGCTGGYGWRTTAHKGGPSAGQTNSGHHADVR